jgi:outer membrane beta-barrel protein
MRASLSIRISAALAATFVAGAAMAAGPARPPSPAAPAASAPADAVPTVSLVGDPAPVPAAASKPGAAGAPAAAPATRPAATPSRAPGRATGPSSSTPALRAGPLGEAAPRPTTDVRVQSRFAVKAKNTLLYGAAEYLSRGDFYNSPGVRVGATYYPFESLGVELNVSHYWSYLNAEAERVKSMLGLLPDSHAPSWLILAGGRYSIGYGKLMVGGLGGAIHFEPQAFVHAGMHAHDGDVGPSGDFGLGLLVFLTPKMFVRIDTAIVYERETRSGTAVGVWGTLPSIAVGGTL